jgi:hypothetical protein
MLGPGKYDDIGTALIHGLKAEGVLLIVVKGALGSGTACKTTPEGRKVFPCLLRKIADEMEKDFKAEPPTL